MYEMLATIRYSDAFNYVRPELATIVAYNMNAEYIANRVHRDQYQKTRRNRYRLFYELFEFMDTRRGAYL